MDGLKPQIERALIDVMDPHMGVNLHEMGMVRDIRIDADGDVEVSIVFPCVGCPAYELIRQDIRSMDDLVGATPGDPSGKPGQHSEQQPGAGQQP